MNEYFDDPEFENILAQCLEDVQRQHRTLEECLQTYPHYAEQLRPLLRVGLITSRMKPPTLSTVSINRLDARLRTEIKSNKRVSTQQRTSTGYGLRRLAAVLVVALLIGFGSGAGLVAASANTLPGDSLYGIKRLWEAIVLALTSLTGSFDGFWEQIAKTRLDEVERLAAEGRLTETALVDFYSALYHFSSLSSPQTDPKIMALMQNTASILVNITPPPEAQVVYRDVLRLAQENVRTGVVQQPPAELPASIIKLTALPTLIPTSTLPPTVRPTFTPTITNTPSRTPIPSITATFTASATATDTPSATPTASRTPRIPATATKTLTPTPTMTLTVTLTITPTSTWTALPLPAPLVPVVPVATQVPAAVATDVPDTSTSLAATRVRATEQSVYLTQTAGPSSATSTTP